MSDGDGCDAGGDHCASIGASSGAGDAGYAVGTDDRTPVPNIKRVTINGAPVSEASHEYVIGRPPEPKKL